MTVTDPVRGRPADARTALDALGQGDDVGLGADPRTGGTPDGATNWSRCWCSPSTGDETAASRVGLWTMFDPAARTLCTTMARDIALLRAATP